MKKIDLTAKQTAMFTSTANEILGGGSAGGGKTYLNKILAITICFSVPGAQVAILRNSSKNLKKNYLQGQDSLISLLRAQLKDKTISLNRQDMVFEFDNGSAIHLMHAERLDDTIENLSGLEFVLIIADEASLIEEDILRFTLTRLRVGSLKIEDPYWAERLPRLQLTTNPGGKSHTYLKQRYINPSAPGTEFKDEYGKKILFIPFGFDENPHLDREEYDKNLKSSYGETSVQYKQLAHGDWDAAAGAFFEIAFRRDKNVIPVFSIPDDWTIERGYDRGYSSPFAYALIATVNGQNEVELKDGRILSFPNGSKIIFKEWYGYNGKDLNIGLKLQHAEIAEKLREREDGWSLHDRIRPGRADNSLWDGELNAYTDYVKNGITFSKADKSKGTRVAGALKMKELFMNAHAVPAEKPGLYFMENCVHCIATIPSLPTSATDPDDVEKEGQPDHLYDVVRYNVAVKTNTVGLLKVVGT